METKILNELRHKIERMLAEDLLAYLKMDDTVLLQWTDTTLHLVEVIHYLYISDLMRNDSGMLMMKKDIAALTFRRMHVKPPCNLSTYLTRIRNMKGKRARTLLEINMHYMQTWGRYRGLASSITIRQQHASSAE